MLSQLVYVSKRKTNCTEEEIEKILDSCKKNNPPLDITGILLYSDTKFIQLVEGESKTIMSLYDKIKGDSRHENCIMISLSPIKEKTFPSWHMGSKKLKNGGVSYDTEISTEHQRIFTRIMEGKQEEGEKVLKTLQKFFLN
ncbi:BLUF domain-containing protein [Marivirga sp. S37H4]|uniref:BLUF domain-containing protein n=1 Tax=Marivirga aurantiaca TaxID=2802615 RepID=A0A935CAI0_9BACT|nr:BLUF domain-containing protein [Marivirga aurantiaca]MBK6266605.1 BLUF domain-containing protein [Marivirga aurantiaca]